MDGFCKVNNDDIWNNYVKEGKVKGFSIEGFFADKLDGPNESVEEDFSSDELDAIATLYDLEDAMLSSYGEELNHMLTIQKVHQTTLKEL